MGIGKMHQDFSTPQCLSRGLKTSGGSTPLSSSRLFSNSNTICFFPLNKIHTNQKRKLLFNIQNRKEMRFFCASKRQSYTKSQAKFTEELREKNFRLAAYGLSIVIAVIGVSYASVPLYKVFCQATGFGGTTKRVESLEKLMEYQRAQEAKEENET